MNPRQRLASQLLSYLAEVPARRWCTKFYEWRGQHCAVGLLGNHRLAYKWANTVSDGMLPDIRNVNDGYVKRYPQPHPKARVINYLCDIVEGIA